MRISAREALEHEWMKSMMASEPVGDIANLESTMQNMRQFQATQKLAQAALLYMGSKLTSAEETKELTEIFSRLDTNGDGQLDRQELVAGYKELMRLKGIDISSLDEQTIENDVDQVLQSVDFDQNGFLEYSEFVTVAMDRKQLCSRERLSKAFNLFDTDGSGKISSNELAQLFGMSELGSDEWTNLIAEIDQNGDGQVDLDEFVQMLAKLCNVKIR